MHLCCPYREIDVRCLKLIQRSKVQSTSLNTPPLFYYTHVAQSLSGFAAFLREGRGGGRDSRAGKTRNLLGLTSRDHSQTGLQ